MDYFAFSGVDKTNPSRKSVEKSNSSSVIGSNEFMLRLYKWEDAQNYYKVIQRTLKL